MLKQNLDIIISMIILIVGLIVKRKILIEKLNDLLDWFGLPVVEFSKEKNKVYEPIKFKSMTPARHYCEPYQSSMFENERTKTATEVMFSHHMREQEVIDNFKFEKEKNKMNKKQLEKRIEQLNRLVVESNDEATRLKNELRYERNCKRVEYVTKTELFVATQEEIEKAKCCETCEAFKQAPFVIHSTCENKIIRNYTGVDIEETKCKEHQFNELKLINKIKEMRAEKEHTERVKKAKPTIVKIKQDEE